MTRDEIVERLLKEGHITAAEAVVLLKEEKVILDLDNIRPGPFVPDNPWVGPDITGPFVPNPFEITGDKDDMVPYGELCSCNPKNGGSGICGCVMANKLVPRNSKNSIRTWTSNGTDMGNIKITAQCPNGPGACHCSGACKK